MKMTLFTLYRKLAGLHSAVGAVRWRSSYRPSPLLTAAPVRALIDERISIKGTFLPPHCPITLCAQMHSEDGDLWEAFAHYNTNSDGTVNLTRDHSVGGSYLGCEPMGLFWGMQGDPGNKGPLRLRKINVLTPYTVQISLLEGHISPSEAQGTELATVITERWYIAPGVRRIDIRQNGVVGTLFLPPGPGPFPGMLDLWGMGGGLMEYRAALIASRGYASLALAFLGHKDLPGPRNTLNVGDSYFKAAFHLLQNHHQVCADRVGIIGISYGSYLALRIATQMGVKPACLICINGPIGSNILLLDAEDGADDYNSDQKHWTFDEQGHVSFREVSLPANIRPEAILKIENIACPLMVIVSEDDPSAASIESANVIEETLKAAGKSELFTRLSYPGAGHLIEPPYAPNARLALWRSKPKKLFTLWGGQPTPHAAAQEDAWEKMLDFMESNLRR
uniref:bile acid-CoA:amino acid N-acyltransferase-like isoform X3 n=1 Tax=Monopterus albus TaxID=43700 RepID=UPI0009B377EE|nr:bile acid-CoA:amino acid N-acyltransferase-like isoform X3 [Monopterus albus]